MANQTEHKEGTATIKWVYFTHNRLKDGSHPFYVRITKGRKVRYIATGLSIHPQYWNEDKNTFRKSYSPEKGRQLMVSLQKWVEKYADAASELATADISHSSESITTKVAEDRKELRKYQLLSYFNHLIEQHEKTGKVGNRKVYRDVGNNLQRYIGLGKDVSFDAVTVKFCNGWEAQMRSEGLSEITLSVKFRTLRAVVNRAISEGYAKESSYPFARNESEKRKFFVGKFNTKTSKRAISTLDIQKIEAYEPEPYQGQYASLRDNTARLLLAKHLFLFSYYCGGVNFVDMALVKWANVGLDLNGNPRLNYTRQKTGGKFSIPLKTKAMAILDHYRPETETAPSEYIFPVLHTALHKTEMQRHNRCNKILGQVNADLKTIGESLAIATALTSYVARHTFATTLRRSGVEVGIISEALGHQDERTTRIYLADLDPDIIDGVFDKL